jgi:hypothetical protein
MIKSINLTHNAINSLLDITHG